MRISDWSSDVCSSDLGRVEMLDESDGDYFQPDFAPDGTSIAAAVILGNRPVYSAKEGEIRIIDLATGAVRVLADGPGIKHQRSEERRGGKECVSTCRSR